MVQNVPLEIYLFDIRRTITPALLWIWTGPSAVQSLDKGGPASYKDAA